MPDRFARKSARLAAICSALDGSEREKMQGTLSRRSKRTYRKNQFRPQILDGQRGTGQIRGKEDENGIGIADAGSLSWEVGEGAGGKQIREDPGRTLDVKVLAKQSATVAWQKLYGNTPVQEACYEKS